MKHLLPFIAVVALLTTHATIALAEGTEEKEHRPKMHTFSGQISSVSSNSITVVRQKHDQEQSETFRIDESTKVLLPASANGGEKKRHVEGSVSDLKVGDSVTVGYTEDRLAKKIAVSAPHSG